MKAYRSMEIVYELIDLANEILSNISQQLSYYKISVYKEEESSKINKNVEDLREIVDVLHDEDMLEAFEDYEAMKKNYLISYNGESCFYIRTLNLIKTMSEILKGYENKFEKEDNYNYLLSKSVSRKKKKLLSMCKYGSRQWSFFQTI